MAKYTYHKTHSYKDKGERVSFISQLYKIGVYGIVNGDPAMQMNLTPSQIVRLEKKLKQAQEKGEITDLEFGESITVTDKSGLWEEVE